MTALAAISIGMLGVLAGFMIGGVVLVPALVYLAGIPWLRTGVWLVSVIGLLLIFFQVL